MSILDDEKIADRITWVAASLALIIIPVAVLFLWKEGISMDLQVDDSKLGAFGDFIGGVLGSIWSLCGVFLFYTALKDQRKDFKINNIALSKQVKALELQAKEFELQREEMKSSRKIFIEQSETLKVQKLETTYFSLIELYRSVLDALNEKDENSNYFGTLKTKLIEEGDVVGSPIEKHGICKRRYEKLYFENREELGQYFRVVYRIIKIIEQAEIPKRDKFNYVKILRSQLSENELLVLYYNSHSYVSEKFYRLILNFNLLKQLSPITKIEFSEYLSSGNGGAISSENMATNGSEFHNFLHEAMQQLLYFQRLLEKEIRNEDFQLSRIALKLKSETNLVLVLSSTDYNVLKIEVKTLDNSAITLIAKCSIQIFERMFSDFLCDAYWFSRYLLLEENGGNE